MAGSVKALVKPELLVWARVSAHLSGEEAARKAQVKEEQLAAWEQGEGQPSIPQLRKLGRVYKRPLAVFYLPNAPKTFDALRDFRRLPAEMVGSQSPELAFEIRRARARREIALDLYQELVGDTPKPFSATASLDENPEVVAGRVRDHLGVRPAEVSSWKTVYDAFNRWRGALEEAGVLVFQAEDVETSEVRGFSFSEDLFPVVVVNIKDAVVGRIFSMLHETVHLMLRQGGLCDFEEESQRAQERIEVFCNGVAGAALMPQASVLAEEVVRQHKGMQWSDEEIEFLAQRFRVSREALIRRLLVLGRASEAFYRKKRKELQAEYEAQLEEVKQKKALGMETGGFAPPDRMAVSKAGPFFVRLVLESYHQERITANDLSSFLDVRLKHIPKIEHAVLNRPMSPGASA
jgi:Zn-dependent peptidase ImmA (M78 family)/transcriptional regulator with XRE-family HTH domain